MKQHNTTTSKGHIVSIDIQFPAGTDGKEAGQWVRDMFAQSGLPAGDAAAAEPSLPKNAGLDEHELAGMRRALRTAQSRAEDSEKRCHAAETAQRECERSLEQGRAQWYEDQHKIRTLERKLAMYESLRRNAG